MVVMKLCSGWKRRRGKKWNLVVTTTEESCLDLQIGCFKNAKE